LESRNHDDQNYTPTRFKRRRWTRLPRPHGHYSKENVSPCAAAEQATGSLCAAVQSRDPIQLRHCKMKADILQLKGRVYPELSEVEKVLVRSTTPKHKRGAKIYISLVRFSLGDCIATVQCVKVKWFEPFNDSIGPSPARYFVKNHIREFYVSPIRCFANRRDAIRNVRVRLHCMMDNIVKLAYQFLKREND
jgi:hypothetical protein